MRNVTVIFTLVAGLVLCGAGCSKSTPQNAANTTNPTDSATTTTKFPTFQQPVKILTPKEELSQILKNYSDTKSFRAKVNATSTKTLIIGVLEFAKPNRFRGIIQQTGSKVSTELIIVDNDLYMRPVDGKWINYSKSKNSRAFGEVMRNALSGEDSLQHMVLDENSIVEKQDDSVRFCTLYTVHLTNKDGERIMNICANNGLPKFVDMTKAGNATSLEYFDYNAIFTVARPI